MTSFIFVTGGVVSGLGKGITAASLGRLLKARGLKVAAQKLDPYINIDPGTMSPVQHGEVFVTADGAETDLDLGHYERFIDEDLDRYANLTSGRVYESVLRRERQGGYEGKTVQVIPHITDEIKHVIYQRAASSGADILITEIGGTVGDIESMPFLEAARQITQEVGPQRSLTIHVTLVPYLQGSEEHKSKPTQHSVRTLQGLGIRPELIVVRSDEPIPEEILSKIAASCTVPREAVIPNPTLSSIYEAPLALEAMRFSEIVCERLGIDPPPIDLAEWQALVDRIEAPRDPVTVGLVGKYVSLKDAYLSVVEALAHAGFALGVDVKIDWIDAETLTETNVDDRLSMLDAVIVPGGFGERGIEGLLRAVRAARLAELPVFGICLGMQLMTIEYARSVLDLPQAHSTEFDADTPDPVITILPGQEAGQDRGGTLRLGAYPCAILPDSRLAAIYGADQISERHRHRYEVNPAYHDALSHAGLTRSGVSPDGHLTEVVECSEAPFYIGVQFHPEFKSRPNRPHPLFTAFIEAAAHHRAQKGTA